MVNSNFGHIGRIYLPALSGIILAFSGCSSNALGPLYDYYSGVYVLIRVDGKNIPVQVGTEANCPANAVEGEMGVTKQSGETLPLYSWAVWSRSSCETFFTRPVLDLFREDVGGWSASNGRLEFRSKKGKGELTAHDIGSSVPVLTFSSGGHSYEWTLVRRMGAELGSVRIMIVDAAGLPVNGAFFELRGSDGIATRGVTNNNQSPVAPVSAGSAILRIAPPTGFVFAAGSPASTSISIVANQVVEKTIVLNRQ